MSQNHYPPAYLRYLRARLWNLARPSIWGTAIFLSVVGLAIKEYWTHPDFLNQQNKQVATSGSDDPSLSKEERASVADIDNLPVLYNESGENSSSATKSTSKENQNANKTLLDELNNKTQIGANNAQSNPAKDTTTPAPTSKIENPFLAQADSLLQMSNYRNGSNSLGINDSTSSVQPGGIGLGTLLQSNSNQNVASVSPLQAALNQSTQNSSLSNSTSTQTNKVGQSLPNNISPNQVSQSTTGSNSNLVNPGSTGSYTQPTVTNLQPGYTNLNTPQVYGGNTQPTATNVPPSSNYYGGNTQSTVTNVPSYYGGNTQPTVTNVPPLPYSNFNTSQVLPATQPTQVVSPLTSTTPTNITPYTQTPSQSNVTPNTVVPNNYGSSNLQPLNPVATQNNPLSPQNSPLSPRRQTLIQSTNGQTSVYSYP